MAANFRTRSREEWEAWFEGRDICWSPVVTLKEAWQSEHVTERGMRFQDDAGNDHVGSAIKFSSEPAQIDTQLPKVGADTAKIIAELGLTDADHEAILEAIDSNVRTTDGS